MPECGEYAIVFPLKTSPTLEKEMPGVYARINLEKRSSVLPCMRLPPGARVEKLPPETTSALHPASITVQFTIRLCVPDMLIPTPPAATTARDMSWTSVTPVATTEVRRPPAIVNPEKYTWLTDFKLNTVLMVDTKTSPVL